MGSPKEHLNNYWNSAKQKFFTPTDDPLSKQFQYYALAALTAFAATVLILTVFGICYDCIDCSTRKRRKSVIARSTSITYQGFGDVTEMSAIENKPSTSGSK
ncbi:uncharacterized protein LOC120346163 [Styela clava]|uniref:uncharacterized protein LOC120346163 n=1 Tax=Styela clava TaxID=7725 RepID=UPI00193AAB22|nr:uncharacterized protein LOC120346163 [Styela clava]